MAHALAAAFGDPRFPWLVLTAALAGLVRGFSGFGAAMVFVPVAAALYSPPAAVVMLFVTDTITALPLLRSGIRLCTWREVLPLVFGATVTMPLGVLVLRAVDPRVMRLGISLAVLALVAVLASGWRYRRAPSLPGTVAVGAASGFCGGMASLWGPPIVLFWLGGQSVAATVRANIVVFLAFASVVGVVTFGFNHMFTGGRVLMALGLMPAYALALFAGSRLFGRASERVFRALALGVCTVVALLTLPVAR